MKKRINYEKQRRRLLREPDDDKIVVRAPFRNLDYIQAQLTQRKKSGRSQQIEVRFEKEWDFEDFAEICQPDEEERGWDENDTRLWTLVTTVAIFLRRVTVLGFWVTLAKFW
eukprot:m.174358 g.174358  ORF g.174358 m.174358 type:complete len:112 (+) comp39111_c1_seq2:173-508(+)